MSSPSSLLASPPPAASIRARAWAWRQWPRDTRDTLFQLAVIGWTLVPFWGHLPFWCVTLTAVVLVWRALLALSNGPLPGRWKVMAVLVVAVGLTAWSERTLLGREAGVMMLVVLVALKTLELRARRDAMVVFFLGFFLVLTHCLYSQSLLIALSMLVSTWGLLTALVLANMPVGRPPLRKAGAVAARSALLGLPLMAMLFLLFPRFGPLWGLPQDGLGRTGLSGSLRLGGMADLANDDSIAFRIRFDGAAPRPEALYFRGPVLSRFDGVEWQPSVFATARSASRALDLRTAGAPLHYEMLLEPIRLALLPMLEATPAPAGGVPLLADWQSWLGHDLQWHTDRLVGERLRLQAEAWTRFEHGRQIEPDELNAMRSLPPDFNPRSIAWAQQVRARLGDADARTLAAALLAYVRQADFVYTLQPGSYGSDAIDEFWLDRREGFCEHYATSFVVLMRAMGVPARVVTGYQGAEPPDADGFQVVRQSHAHAWAEYWTPDAGWLRADPTAAVSPERVRASRSLPPQPGLVAGALNTMNPELASRLRHAWELLDNRWNQWVMGYSRTRQFNLLRAMGVSSPDWVDVARVLVIALSAVAGAGALWAWRDRRRQDPWTRLHGRLCRRLQAIGVPALPHHPPRTLAAMVHARHGAAGLALAQLMDGLDLRRYGPNGARLPERGWWAQVRHEAGRLKAPLDAPG
jgi:transglutaminase-like putative cysteine protease